MSRKVFFAQQWLRPDLESERPHSVQNENTCQKFLSSIDTRFATFTPKKAEVIESNTTNFSPSKFLTPGWQGDSLQSRSIVDFELYLDRLQYDIKYELLKTKDFPRSIKLGLYTEFLSYAENLSLQFEGLDDLASFWQYIDVDRLNEIKELSEFIDIYVNRVAAITFYKLRFISSLIDTVGLELNDKALLYPTSFLTTIFKIGSHNELFSRSLESNYYSWYRPQESMKGLMKELTKLSAKLSISEITKIISFRTQVKTDQSKVYSHSLSHMGFGLFLNSLLINFPTWQETIEGKSSLDQEKVISCKYYGDYLESLSLSHWLAQENNKSYRWENLLCPDFKGLNFSTGVFTKICNELQFLTFLAHKAQYQNERPIEYISRIMRAHFNNRKGGTRQGLLLEENPFFSSTYDRIILNLCHFPKSNPQHYQMNQISEQIKYLKNNGYLFVISSKKLFVPSLRDRLGPIVKELKTEAIFDLEDVKGKGELGSYLYIFRKKSGFEKKQTCSYFRVSAELKSFHHFSSLTEYLRTFYLNHLTEVPAMAQLEFPDSFRIEFYQEAVVDGMLIHSTNEDSSRITHPAFFKGLLDNCTTLNNLFEIKSLSIKDQAESGLNLGLKQDVSYFLVVDFRQPAVNLELHPMDTFRSIHSDRGETQCCYFQLFPKIAGLNPNILRNYFLTPIGQQVANITFTGGLSLVKGSLSRFLVPKFFTQTELLPGHLSTAFEVLNLSEDQLLEADPISLAKSFNHIEHMTKDLFSRYACEILTRLSSFERNLQNVVFKMEDSRFGQKVSFNNSAIQSQLVQKPTHALYPNNKDVYLEFIDSSRPQDIHLPLTETSIQITHEADIKLVALELKSNNKVIVRLHADELMISFLNFILIEAQNVAISKLLRAVYIPSLNDIKSVVEDTQLLRQTYSDLIARVQNTIQDAFRRHVTPKRTQ
ncbi:MAG TPA: hypothetical protein VKZ84_00965 [Bacteriovoracaceae bacterium]|nr:hypothetical protein [Bacteriovoracaceae bacterium]